MMTTTRTAPAPAGFTPGPWFMQSPGLVCSASGIVCEVCSPSASNDAPAQATANAHLIAASTELYHALRTALVVVAGCNADGYFRQQEREIRSALALAEGRMTATAYSRGAIGCDSEGGEA